MPTPRKGYRLADGTRVPGVTTVLGNLGWNKNALMWWAWNEGSEGRDFRDTSQKAADVGTVAHALVEERVHGRDPLALTELPGLTGSTFTALREKALPCLAAFDEWADQVSLEIVSTEQHLVSEIGRFGGTPDAVGRVSGKLRLLDFKTSKAVYADFLIQLAAYQRLWNECKPEQQLDEGAFLLRIGKDGGFAYHYYTQDTLDLGWMVFEHLTHVHDAKKKLEDAA